MVHGVRLLYAVEASGELRAEVDGLTDSAAWVELADVSGLSLSDHARWGCIWQRLR